MCAWCIRTEMTVKCSGQRVMTLRCLVAGFLQKKVRVDDIDVASFVERLRDFVEEIFSHDIIVELPGASYIEGESSDFPVDFAMVCFVVLGFRGGEFGTLVQLILSFNLYPNFPD